LIFIHDPISHFKISVFVWDQYVLFFGELCVFLPCRQDPLTTQKFSKIIFLFKTVGIKEKMNFLGFLQCKLIFFFFKFYYPNLLTTQQKYIFSSGSILTCSIFRQPVELDHLFLNPQYFYLFFLKN